MTRHPSALRALAVLVLSALAATFTHADPATAVTTAAAGSALLDDASSLVSSKIAEAKDAGKELELEFYKSLMQTLDRFKEIVDGGAAQLDRGADMHLRKAAFELRELVKNTDQISRQRMFEMMVVTNSLNQSVANLPWVEDRLEVTSIWPTVIKQRRSGAVTVSVLGVGLADCDSVSLQIGAESFEPSTNLGNSLEFIVPYTSFNHGSPDERPVRATLILDPGWFSRDKRLPIVFRVLPDKIASFKLQPHLGATRVVYSDVRSVPFAKLSGRDGRRSVTVKPTEGWRIDTKSISIKKLGGEKSSDMRIDGLPTELGFVIYSDMGHIKRNFRKKPGWATFSYSWREFKELPAIEPGTPISGSLTMMNGAAMYTLDPQAKYVTGSLTDFTGRSYAITPGRTTYGWTRVDHVKASNTVVIDSDLWYAD